MRSIALAILVGLGGQSAQAACGIIKPLGPSIAESTRYAPTGFQINSADEYYAGPAICTGTGAWVLLGSGDTGCVVDGARGLVFYIEGGSFMSRYDNLGRGTPVACYANGAWDRKFK